MDDPPIDDLLRPSDFAYYRAIPLVPGRLPRRDTPEALRKSADKAHDNLRAVVRENDRLRLALLKMHRRQKWGLRGFTALLGFTWSVMGWIVKLVLPCVLKAMAK